MRLTRLTLILGLLWPGVLLAQDSQPASQPSPASQPASEPASGPTSRPSLPPPELVTATGPLIGWEPRTPEPESKPVEPRENLDILPPPPPPSPAAMVGNEIVASLGLAFVGGAAGALGGVFLSAQDNNLLASAEETALGWEAGVALGAGLGAGLSGRSQRRGGSRVGALLGSLILGGGASLLGHQVSGIRQNGFEGAKAPEVLLFAIPFVASVTGSVLGYEFFPRKKVKLGENRAKPEEAPPLASAFSPKPVAPPAKSANK